MSDWFDSFQLLHTPTYPSSVSSVPEMKTTRIRHWNFLLYCFKHFFWATPEIIIEIAPSEFGLGISVSITCVSVVRDLCYSPKLHCPMKLLTEDKNGLVPRKTFPRMKTGLVLRLEKNTSIDQLTALLISAMMMSDCSQWIPITLYENQSKDLLWQRVLLPINCGLPELYWQL